MHYCNSKLFNFLLQDKKTALHYAVLHWSNAEIVESLIKCGVDIEAVDKVS